MKQYLLLGDSNVRRWVPRFGTHYLETVEFLPAHNESELTSSLNQVKSSYQLVVFAGLTNLIVGAAPESASRFERLEAISAVIKHTLQTLSETMTTHPGPSYFLAMPTVRSRPQWYISAHHDLIQLIFSTLKSTKISLRPIRAFPMSGQDLDSDGIHMNALAGMTYIHYLIDQARASKELYSNEGADENVRFLAEGMVQMSASLAAHELQIKMLNDKLLIKSCQQAEEACGRINVDNLNRFVVIGAPYLPLSDQLQAKLKSQVAYFIRALNPGLPLDIIHVRQFRGKNGGIYDVEMGSVMSSHRVRTAYGMCYRRGSKGPPPAISKISITNSLTYASRVRVRLMKRVAKTHQASNPDLQVFVTSYQPRPVLKVKEKKGPMMTYSFCETMQRFSHHLTHEFLVEMTRFANIQIPKEDLTSTFLLLSPDLLRGSGETPATPLPAGPPLPGPSNSRAVAPISTDTSPILHSQVQVSSGSSKRKLSGKQLVISKKGKATNWSVVKNSKRAKQSRNSTLPSTEAMDTEASPVQPDPTQPGPVAIEPIDFSQEAGSED